MKQMILTTIVLLLLLLKIDVQGQTKFQTFQFNQKGILFSIDPRMELLNTMEMLIGNPDAVPNTLAYKQEIFEQFYKYKNDSAISSLLQALMHWKDLSSPVFYMLYFDKDLNLLPNLDTNIVKSGGGITVMRELAKRIKEFSERTHYADFFNSHKDFYKLILKNTQYNFRDFDEKERIENYYGLKNHSYTVILNLLEGNGNWGNYIASAQGNDLYAIISTQYNNGDVPAFVPSFETYNLIYHEFSHSFVNHLVYENETEVSKYKSLLEPVKASMASQGYDNWTTVVHESIVRSITARLAAQKFGNDIAFKNFYKQEIGRRFIYVKAITDKIKLYEQNRNKYKTFNEFFPQLLTCFSSVSDDYVTSLQALVKENREPDVDKIPKPFEAKYDSSMVFIISSHERSKAGQDSLLGYVKKYRALITDKIKIITDEDAFKTDLSDKDIIVFGTINGNSFLKKYITLLPLTITDSSIAAGRTFKGKHFQIVASWLNPFNKNRVMIIHTAQQTTDIQNYFYSRYKDGNNYWIAQNLVTIAKGDYKRWDQIWNAE